MTAARSDLATSVAVALLGLVVWWGTVGIDTEAGLFEGPRLLPCIVGTGLLVLASVLGVGAALRMAGDARSTAASQSDPTDGGVKDMGVAIPISGLLIFYVGLLIGFGYLIATLVVAPFAFWLFGNRGRKHLLVLPTILTVVYYVLFFQLLGMFDPPGEILDVSTFLAGGD
jgi:putative tricarboxylic transport membrane protein